MKQWHVLQARLGREAKAALAAYMLGFDYYLPTVERELGYGWKRRRLADVPRFPSYVFVRFDADADNWPALLLDGPVVTRHVARLFRDRQGRPIPVPDQAISAVRDYVPPAIVPLASRPFVPGEAVIRYIAGTPYRAVFIAYENHRARVLTWILGAERAATVSASELEHAEEAWIDSQANHLAGTFAPERTVLRRCCQC